LKHPRVNLLFFLLAIFLALTIHIYSPARAQERPTPTIKACHICEEEIPLITPTGSGPVVRAVLFTSHICGFCSEIVELKLPPVIQEFRGHLEILEVDVNTPEGDALFEAALGLFDNPRGTPMIFVGNTVLGGNNIPSKLPGVVKTYLAQGGAGWPAIPGLEEYIMSMEMIATPTIAAPIPTAMASVLIMPSTALPTGSVPAASVHAVILWMPGCPSCQEVLENVLPAIQGKYGQQLEIQLVEVVTREDVDRLYEIGASYGIPREEVGVPLLVIGQHILIGSSQIPAELPGLIEAYLAQGGLDWPDNPSVADLIATPRSPSTEATPTLMDFPATSSERSRNNGFTLAMLVLAGMIISLVYAFGRLIYGVFKDIHLAPLPAWRNWLTPILCLIGLGVAGYLSYVEITSVPAMCGPVGNCNSVQTSSYARLWGVLPIGVLGVGGYIAILASWWAGRQKWSWVSAYVPFALFGMAFFGTVFSAYLTYLEPFVIKAVCMWCISSSVIMTLLLLLSVRPALRNLIGDHHAEETPS
jgi:uncharacterized membrane protein